MIIENILDYAIKNKRKIYLNLDQQLLIYIKGEKGVKKTKVVKALEIGFTLLNKWNKLVIFVSTNSIANDIGENMI